jgi:outer membrane protein OmpA-like peptidoglycan-associated protein
MSRHHRSRHVSFTTRGRAGHLVAALAGGLLIVVAGDRSAAADPAAAAEPAERARDATTEQRLHLRERIMFDAERARVRSKNARALAAVSILWRLSPEWERLVIEGHSDRRGPAEFNQWLSEERAARVRDALIATGVPAAERRRAAATARR